MLTTKEQFEVAVAKLASNKIDINDMLLQNEELKEQIAEYMRTNNTAMEYVGDVKVRLYHRDFKSLDKKKLAQELAMTDPKELNTDRIVELAHDQALSPEVFLDSKKITSKDIVIVKGVI